MKFLPFLLVSLFIPLTSIGQCPLPNALKVMETPRASFMHSSGASLWWDGATAQTSIHDPSLSSEAANVVFAAGIWFGLIDEGNNIFVRSSLYELAQGQSAFAPGPITPDFPNATICSLFNRIWEIHKSEIDAHNLDWFDNQTIDNDIPDNIKHWPGRGNKFIEQDFGVTLPDMDLAPFWDQNNNGQYEPDLGDFPDSRGATVAHWWMFNDSGDNAQSQIGIPTADFAVLAYSFDDELSTTSTFFYEYKITNRTEEVFPEMRISLWVDGDLGCYEDDFIGCQPDNQLAYYYNADAIDGQANSCSQAAQAFDIDIPIFGIKILDGIDYFDDNQGWVDNGLSAFTYSGGIQPTPGDLTNVNNYWHVMSGRWPNGTPMTVGGNGYNPMSDDNTAFAFSDNPDDENGWSMCTENISAGDRRVNLSSGPGNFHPGQIQKFAFAAIVTGAIDDYPCPVLDPLVEAADAAQEVYYNIVSGQQSPAPIAETISIFPNPTTDILNINLGQSSINQFQLYDSQGKLIQTQIFNQQNVQFSMEHLPKGLYILSFKNALGQNYNQRIVKI